jgi:hypothetical protein
MGELPFHNTATAQSHMLDSELLGRRECAMLTIVIMLLLIVVAGWFDSRLNWREASGTSKIRDYL